MSPSSQAQNERQKFSVRRFFRRQSKSSDNLGSPPNSRVNADDLQSANSSTSKSKPETPTHAVQSTTSITGNRLHNKTSTVPEIIPEIKTGVKSDAGKVSVLPAIPALDNSLVSIANGSVVKDKTCVTLDDKLEVIPGVKTVDRDIWSVAFRDALGSLDKHTDMAIFTNKSIEKLFNDLAELDKQSNKSSAFRRGVERLQVPLKNVKLALDVTSPLTSIDPTANIVFGVVKGATAIAITFATASEKFTSQIEEMLRQLAFIDKCDTIGQTSEDTSKRREIHDALVSVYIKLLEFYLAAYEMLQKKTFVFRMILDDDRLPGIVEGFLKRAEILHKIINNAILKITEDINQMMLEQLIGGWLDIAKLDEQLAYHWSLIGLKSDLACKFLLTDANFETWYQDSESRPLVIMGDMGCGKSVAMAFLIEELEKRNKHRLPEPKICYHYCGSGKAAGEATDIYSVLILRLLQELKGLQKPFYTWYNETASRFDRRRKLEGFLLDTLESLDRPLFVVIDGLDECPVGSRDVLFTFLKELMNRNARLKILLSCRPGRDVLAQMDGMSKINLESDDERDRIIVQHTVSNELKYLSEDIKRLIIDDLTPKAKGNAQWVKMTVKHIQTRHRRLNEPEAMKDFLDETPLPDELSKLYDAILSRSTEDDPVNWDSARTALQVLAVTRRPLCISEIAWAVAVARAPRKLTTIAALKKKVDPDSLMGFISPFIARYDSDDLAKRQIRLVHKSVKDFIAHDNDESDAALRLKFCAEPIDVLEKLMVDICIRYLLLEEIDQDCIFSEEQLAIGELPQETDLFSDDGQPGECDMTCTWDRWEENMTRYDPPKAFGLFFVYASCHWIDHFRATAADDLPNLESIEKLCHPGSNRLHNWIEQNRRPNCTIMPRIVPFDSTLYDPLSITALYGSEAMLCHMIAKSDFSPKNFLSQPAMRAAGEIIRWGDLGRVRILLFEAKFSHQLKTMELFEVVIDQWSRFILREGSICCGDWNSVFELVDDCIDSMVRDHWANELLCVAAKAGCVPIIERLRDKAQQDETLKAELTSLPSLKVSGRGWQ